MTIISERVGRWLHEQWPAMLAVMLALAAWEAVASLGLIHAVFFPPPSQIIIALGGLVAKGVLLPNLGATALRLAVGFLLGALPGLALGLLMGWSARIRKIIDPFVGALHVLPKIALLPLALVMFGIGEAPKVVLIAVSAFFPMLISVMVGVQRIHPVYYEVARNYGARGFQIVRNVLLPASLPEILAGVRLGLNTALLITIALEMVFSNDGLGKMVWLAWQTMRVSQLYACLVIIAALGILINAVYYWTGQVLIPWRETDH